MGGFFGAASGCGGEPGGSYRCFSFIFFGKSLPSVAFGTRQSVCRVPDKRHTAKAAFADT
jgi:hypothetical protein